MSDVIFLTIASKNNLTEARLMIDSLRTFGGEMADMPFWVFASDPNQVRVLEKDSTRVLSLTVPGPVAGYILGKKVAACARAEELVPADTRSLVWVDAGCVITQPPTLLNLSANYDAAFRPVHIRNVGLPPSDPLDAFWSGIYAALGVEDIHTTVTSFVDNQVLRTYFNSHSFAIHPSLGLMRRWYELFQKMVNDAQFQSAACMDEIHQIFLFQALLSTLVATSINPARICFLPPTYNYPYNLHDRVPQEKRPAALNDLVSFTYEERSIRPTALTGIEVHEPLRSWLESRI